MWKFKIKKQYCKSIKYKFKVIDKDRQKFEKIFINFNNKIIFKKLMVLSLFDNIVSVIVYIQHHVTIGFIVAIINFVKSVNFFSETAATNSLKIITKSDTRKNNVFAEEPQKEAKHNGSRNKGVCLRDGDPIHRADAIPNIHNEMECPLSFIIDFRSFDCICI